MTPSTDRHRTGEDSTGEVRDTFAAVRAGFAIVATVLMASLAACGSDDEDAASVRAACTTASEASLVFENARQVNNLKEMERATEDYEDALQLARSAGANDLAEQIELITETVPELSSGGGLPKVSLRIAEIEHGRTGIIIECDKAGIEVQY
jgi:hypothetical protein